MDKNELGKKLYNIVINCLFISVDCFMPLPWLPTINEDKNRSKIKTEKKKNRAKQRQIREKQQKTRQKEEEEEEEKKCFDYFEKFVDYLTVRLDNRHRTLNKSVIRTFSFSDNPPPFPIPNSSPNHSPFWIPSPFPIQDLVLLHSFVLFSQPQ